MDIDIFELKQKMERGDDFLLLDVREQHEFREFNLGGKLIPLGYIPLSMVELEPFRNQEIVVHCRVGSRSKVAQTLLLRAGFQQVRNLKGGVVAWVREFGY
jgi:rhodanese-related sulfurtransferase